MHRLFFDTNILLDVLERRAPWFPESSACLAKVRRKKAHGSITALSLSDICYIQRATPAEMLYHTFKTLRSFLELVPMGAKTIDAALDRQLPDMEDGFQFEAALQWKATHLITRNMDDFPEHHSLRIQSPIAYLKSLSESDS